MIIIVGIKWRGVLGVIWRVVRTASPHTLWHPAADFFRAALRAARAEIRPTNLRADERHSLHVNASHQWMKLTHCAWMLFISVMVVALTGTASKSDSDV
jgi:hypothetical protein